MEISLVVAVDRGGIIGKDRQMPWHLPADLRHFKAITMGKPMVMGRKTFESIGRPLPGRANIVLTRQNDFHPPGCQIAGSPGEALALAEPADEVMIIGGSSVYEAFICRASLIYMTAVHGRFDGDTRFGCYRKSDWQEVEREDHQADEKNPYPYSFLVLKRQP